MIQATRSPLVHSSLRPRSRLSDGWAFCLVAAFMAIASIVLRGSADLALDWQPSLAFTEPWRWWTAAFVHYSNLHLLANLAGAALVGALGFVARVPTPVAAAWLVAWPLTHIGLLLEPRLLHYGGMSGVLHAGVAVVAMQVMAEGTRRRRWLGAAILAGIALKVVMEAPWTGPLQHREGWDIAIAPFAHATGLAAGVAVGALLLAATQLRMRLTSAVVE